MDLNRESLAVICKAYLGPAQRRASSPTQASNPIFMHSYSYDDEAVELLTAKLAAR